jgi:Condensation domain
MLRSLGSLEKRFWLLDQSTATHSVLAAEIEGRTAAEDWRLAFDIVQDRHPFCTSFAKPRGGPKSAFVQNASASIPLRIFSDRDPADWTKVVESELATPFNTFGAPPLRAVLLHQPERSVLILSAHHTLSDGVALSYLIRDIVKAVADEQPDTLPVPRSIDESMESAMNSPKPAWRRESPHAARYETSARKGLEKIPSVDRLQMSHGFTGKLSGRAEEEGTTVHSALCAALVVAGRAMSEKWKETTIRVLSPVNIRKTVGVNEDFDLYITSTIASFEPQTTSGFWNLARFIKRGLTVPVSLQNLADQTGALKKVFDANEWDAVAQMLTRRMARELMLTNLGRIPFGTGIGKLQISSIWGPLALPGHSGEQTVGVATTNGALSMVIATRSPMPGLLDHSARILASACEAAE